MKTIIYCSSITLPSSLSNRLQTLSMARAFNKKIGGSFYFGMSEIGRHSEAYLKYLEDLDKERILLVGAGKSYWLALKYIKFIKRNKIQYVYCREPHLLLFLIFYSKLFFAKPKFIYEAHIAPQELLEKTVNKFLFRLADYFTFVTRGLRSFYIEKYKCSPEKTLFSPDGVDLDIFNLDLTIAQAREKLGLPLDKKIIGYFGRFKTIDMEKGLGTVLEALRLTDKDTLFLAMGGKRADLKHYSAVAEELGVRNKVFLVGHYNQREVALRQKACDILLMPFPRNQHYAYYMSPTKMFEYMASRRPIIASDLPSVREILSEKSAFFVSPGNPEDLAQMIKRVLENQEIADRVAQQAFEDVPQYTWQNRVEKILDFIGFALDKPLSKK